MAGNSQRKGARRTEGSKKGATAGSGGRKSKGLRPKGPTPRAEERGKATKRSSSPGARAQAERRGSAPTGRATTGRATTGRAATGRAAGGRPAKGRPAKGQPAKGRPTTGRAATGRATTGRAPSRTTSAPSRPPARRRESSEFVAGRNAVVEALRAHVPTTALYVAERIDSDDRVKESLRLATDRRLPLLEVPRSELDRMSAGSVHQGLVLQVPPYVYAHPDDLASLATGPGEVPLLVALDSVTDPRNLGAVVRSAAAFGAQGVVVPERRSAGMTAGAWKASAGAAARVPVARATNLTRQLEAYRSAGFVVVGLSADGTVDAADLEVAVDPLVLVLGSEDQGLSRLVERTCDVLVRIPMASGTESLNAGVAAGIVLYEVARRRAAR